MCAGYSTFQESFVGQIIYLASGRRILRYVEERDDFVLPARYASAKPSNQQQPTDLPSRPRFDIPEGTSRPSEGGIKASTSSGSSSATQVDHDVTVRPSEKQNAVIIVTWYNDEDPENPQNWSLGKKCWLVWCIMLITTSVYIGSSIYAPAVPSAMEYFGVSEVPALLGISLFVLGYGIGPLFLSPITEVPKIGRTLPYIIPLALFTILQVPTALVTNFAGFCVLRFLAGFVSSPPLATGGASLFDIFAPEKFAYPMGLYDISAAAGPTLGPVVAAYAVYHYDWRWAFWILLWIAGFALIFLACALPETSADNILYRRAVRLRRLTGNPNIKSQCEIDTAHLDFRGEILTAIIRPISMTFKEPIILATDLYVGYVYALIYSYFESFPIVYQQGYGWSGANSNLPYLAFIAGESLSVVGYMIWARMYWEPKFAETQGHPKPEASLPMGIPGGFFAPPTLFWFGWTAVRTHWINPVLASALFGLGTSWMFMPFLTYLPLAYPKFAASALASNDFVRSLMGAGMPLAAAPLFHNLGIAWGNSLLGFVAIAFVPVPWLLFAYGGKLRNRSPMALHDSEIEKMRAGTMASV